MHRWRTDLFRHLLHGLEVELRVIEQRQLHLLAHRGHVSLAEQKLGRAAPAIAALGVRQFQFAASPIVRRTGPPRIGSGWVSFCRRYVEGGVCPR
jgi:hypothetical protein